MFPPQQVMQDARTRHQCVTAGLRPGTITIGGADVAGAVAVGDETFALGPHGTSRVQSFEALVRKSAVATRPTQGEMVTILGRGYKIDEVWGHNESDESWHLRGSRTPGKDE